MRTTRFTVEGRQALSPQSDGSPAKAKAKAGKATTRTLPLRDRESLGASRWSTFSCRSSRSSCSCSCSCCWSWCTRLDRCCYLCWNQRACKRATHASQSPCLSSRAPDPPLLLPSHACAPFLLIPCPLSPLTSSLLPHRHASRAAGQQSSQQDTSETPTSLAAVQVLRGTRVLGATSCLSAAAASQPLVPGLQCHCRRHWHSSCTRILTVDVCNPHVCYQGVPACV